MLNLLSYILTLSNALNSHSTLSMFLWRGCFYEGQPVYLSQYCQYFIAATISNQRQYFKSRKLRYANFFVFFLDSFIGYLFISTKRGGTCTETGGFLLHGLLSCAFTV